MGQASLANSSIIVKTMAFIEFWSPTAPRKKDKALILSACQERVSLRGIARLFGVARQQVAQWIRAYVQNLTPLRASLLPAEPDEALEFDEAWSFVLC